MDSFIVVNIDNSIGTSHVEIKEMITIIFVMYSQRMHRFFGGPKGPTMLANVLTMILRLTKHDQE